MFEPLLLRSAVQFCLSYAASLQLNQMAGNKENRGVSKTSIEGAVTYFDPNENARNCWQLYRCAARALAAVGAIWCHRDFFARNKNTFGRWFRRANCKAVFITGTPPFTGKAFIQPVFAELYSWSEFLLTGKNVKLACLIA
jgi:hypothetical protein